MSTPKPKVPVQPQATPFQRFTIRLMDGRFVRVPKADLPSTEARVDKTLTSNQTEMRELFRSVNAHSAANPVKRIVPSINPDIPLPAQHGPDPTFDLPEYPPLPARDSSSIQRDP